VAYKGELYGRYIDIDIARHTHLQGRNGCGKTSLLLRFSGIVHDQYVRINDTTEYDLAALRRRAYYVHDIDADVKWSVFDYIMFCLEDLSRIRDVIGLICKDRSSRDGHSFGCYSLLSLLEWFGLSGDVRVSQLSTGQRKRLALLILLLRPPPMLMLIDELFANIDVSMVDRMADILVNYIREYQCLTIIVDHSGTSVVCKGIGAIPQCIDG
jgi:ABC-type transport system involved in cytochrome c biogenesis ATPase subunit